MTTDVVSEAPSGDAARPTSYRAFRPADLPGILRVAEAAWPHDPITESWFTNYVLLDPRFDPEGLLVALDGDRIVGLVRAVAAGAAASGVPAEGGWIPLLLVVPQARNRGIGSELLRRSLEHLRARGARWADVAAYAPGYLLPGVDLDNAPEGAAFLGHAGFATVEEPVGMRIELAGYRAPEGTAELEAETASAGYVLSACTPGELPELLRFAAAVTDGDWREVLHESVLRHGDPGRIQIVREPGGAIAGFATFGSYEGVMERFGPFGVDPAQRGRSLGRLLLHRTLLAMRERGLATAWFLWTELDGPAGRLYSRAGFRPIRRFRVLRRPLD